MEDRVISAAVGISLMNKVGPSYANIHLPLIEIKRALDPNNVANPTRFINVEEVEVDTI